MGLKTWIIKKGVFGGAVRLIARDFQVFRQAGMRQLTAYIAVVLNRYSSLPSEKNTNISTGVLRAMREHIGTFGDISLRWVCYFVAQHEASVLGVEEDVYAAIGEILEDLNLREEHVASRGRSERYSTSDFDDAMRSLGPDPSIYIDPITDFQEYAAAIENSQTSAATHRSPREPAHGKEESRVSARTQSNSKTTVYREVDRRPKLWEYTGIWDDYSKASIVKETVKLASSESSKPIASSDRDEGTAPDQLSITKKTVIREIDRRPRNREHTGILDHDSNAAKTSETPSSPHSQPSKPKAHNVRDEPTGPPQALRTSFCSPVTIESPSRAIRGEKLVEDVGLVTSSGDFIVILDKFSWLPHSRTSPIALATPTEGPVTVTFARRRSAFNPECTPLGTFFLTGFSGDKAIPNALEIRVSAEDSELYFDVRDAAGSHLTITRQS